jgi:hypothetical protein
MKTRTAIVIVVAIEAVFIALFIYKVLTRR